MRDCYGESRFLGSREMEVTFSVDLASGRAGDGDSFMRTVVVSGKKNSALTIYYW
jgi:hypothetical protein